jgi:hypothetical protein
MDSDVVEVLAESFARGLSLQQLTNLSRHLQAGIQACCGRRAWYFVHPAGYFGPEVLANEPSLPENGLCNGRAPAKWEDTFVRLCRVSGGAVNALAAHDYGDVTMPLTNYSWAIERATCDNVKDAVKIALSKRRDADVHHWGHANQLQEAAHAGPAT